MLSEGMPCHVDSHFSSAINKAQGQTLRCVGVIGECFTHGQLYVAASRVGLPEHLRFAVPRDPTTGTFRLPHS